MEHLNIFDRTIGRLIAKELHGWLSGIGVKTAYIEPSSPWENAF
jgi:hypothetical protein